MKALFLALPFFIATTANAADTAQVTTVRLVPVEVPEGTGANRDLSSKSVILLEEESRTFTFVPGAGCALSGERNAFLSTAAGRGGKESSAIVVDHSSVGMNSNTTLHDLKTETKGGCYQLSGTVMTCNLYFGQSGSCNGTPTHVEWVTTETVTHKNLTPAQ